MKRKIRGDGLPPESIMPIVSKLSARKSRKNTSPARRERQEFQLPKSETLPKHSPGRKLMSRASDLEVFFCSVSQDMPNENGLLGNAYEEPKKYEDQQISNAHLNAESAILNRLHPAVWPISYFRQKRSSGLAPIEKTQTIVSLGCGSGWLDRRLIDMLKYDLKRFQRRIKLLGVDTHPDIIGCARRKMDQMLDEDKSLKKLVETQYLIANLEGPTEIPLNNGIVKVPGFADIDLRKTIIGSYAPDLFIAFYLFFWTQDKDAAIRSIAEKSREAETIRRKGKTVFTNPTRFISGEEFPLHLTPNPHMTENFKNGVRNFAKPIDIHELWKKFEAAGFGLFLGTDGKEPLKSSDEHWIHYRVMEFRGKPK